jgi:hypothetical protein
MCASFVFGFLYSSPGVVYSCLIAEEVLHQARPMRSCLLLSAERAALHETGLATCWLAEHRGA